MSNESVQTFAIIACTRKKRDERSRADQLYLGGRFVGFRAVAWRNKWEILVLSAKHGLVTGETLLRPYDESLADKTPEQIDEWAENVDWVLATLKKERDLTPGNCRFIVFAEDLYALPLREHGIVAEYPLLGMDEEQQKQFLRDELAK